MIIKKFEEQVEGFPKKIAIVTENRKLSYEEVNQYANQLAQQIRKGRMISSEGQKTQIVGLLFEHSADMVVAVLAALKAEKAYLPLDITYPGNRLAYMLEDSQTHLVLTNTNNLTLAEDLSKKIKNDLEIINIDTINTDGNTFPGIVQREPSNDRLAYILYTSGSTGKPRGVIQNHENVCYYVRNWIERFSIIDSDRMTLFSAFSHDGAGQDMFGALHSGATLYPYNILTRPNAAGLIQWLKEEEITIWHSVPTIYRYFVNALADRGIGSGYFPHLRFILLGGEQVRDHDITMFKRFFPNAVFANVYGQTESSVDSIWLVRPEDPVNKMLIGDPLDRTEILIVNGDGDILEDLGVGEIIVACGHISPGYWNHEGGNKERFAHDPELGKLYRTGDLGRLLADGSIEFMGRKDAQVKIRGFRIETGEIETGLLTHKAVKEAVVAARKDEKGDTHLCAYFVTEPGQADVLTVTELRDHLSGELPDYMIPSYFIPMDALPLTPNGKVDRKKLPDPEPIRPRLGVNYVAPKTSTEQKITAIWKDILNLDKVGINDNFFDLGGTSFDMIKVMSKLHDILKKDIPVVALFQYSTIGSFVKYLDREETGTVGSNGDVEERPGRSTREGKPFQIAVIGMAARFPGAKNIHEFWENLKNGVESITFFSTGELETGGIDPRVLNNTHYVKAKGIIPDIEYFDAAFFNYSPNEALVMDPQLRILHECSWQALEDSGYEAESYNDLIGLYLGNAPNQYWVALTYLNQINSLDTIFLNNNYSTKISYKLNLKGPSVTVQTACSTSLVAIHLACQGLINRECAMALAGGVSITLPDKDGYLYREGMILSLDGHCRPFDAKAGGTVFGNGYGMVVLKWLEDAIADRDTVHAVIKGTAINNDGSRKVGITAPSVDGQAEVIKAARQLADVEPESIGYVEAHGTGTILGDPVEIEALKLAFNTGKKGFCKIGSVKSNVGHLNIASGVSGFIKTVLALKHKMIPPSLNFGTANPGIDFENSPFVVNTELTGWKKNKYPLRAGVSAFGIGGTNAHAILEEAPEIEESSKGGRSLKMVVLSAASKASLEKAVENLGNYLKENPGVNLSDAAYTLQVGRKACKLRKMFLCSAVDEAVKRLLEPEEPLTPETGKVHTVTSGEDNRPVVFMFSGQGAQYVNMGLELYQTEPVFRMVMDRCFEILQSLIDYNIKEILYPNEEATRPPGHQESTKEKGEVEEQPAAGPERINQTEIAQPVLFIFEYALARLLLRWGITPYAMIGHSIGEYVAACLSGVLTLEDALKLVVLRGKLMQQIPGGSMLSIPLPEDQLKPLLTAKNELSLAAVNTTSNCVVSGPHEVIDWFERQLKEEGLNCRRLYTSHAFHSAMMDPILEGFEQTVKEVTLNEPLVPYLSNVTGKWITGEEAADPAYWGKHLRSTVRFGDGLSGLLKEAETIFIEVGPGRTLSTFVRQHKDKKPGQMNINLVRHPKEEVSDSYYLLSKIGRLWLNGKRIDWWGFYSEERRHRISLPTYPFRKQRYWLEGNPYKMGAVEGEPGSFEKAAAGKRRDIADWFYIATWKTSVVPGKRNRTPVITETSNWLLFTDEYDVGTRLEKGLKEKGHHVVMVRPGPGFASTGNNEYTVNPGKGEDYDALIGERSSKGKIPNRVVHLWNVTKKEGDKEPGFYSLLHLARALGKQGLKEELRVHIAVVTNRMQAVTEEDLPYPQKTVVMGPVLVIPREYPNISCRSIDIDIDTVTHDGWPGAGTSMDSLLEELLSDREERVIALRGSYRWVKGYEPGPMEKSGEKSPRLKEGGVYLVTGGLGGIGLVLARYLAETLRAKLILTGRTPLPPREEWNPWLDSHDHEDSISNKIRSVQQLEDSGAEVLVFGADVADREQMQEMFNRAGERFGKINGVIHSAGVPDGGLIQVRTKEMSERVFTAKIGGTLVLDTLLKDTPLDFFILCSSVSAVTAPVGQVAYSAANNFLDNFAFYKTLKDNTFTVSINWDAWQEVGMAVEALKQFNRSAPKGLPGYQSLDVDYPFFDRCEVIDSNQVVYISRLRADKCWFLDEHRISGKATFPGTAYLEMTRAAFQHHSQNGTKGAVELREFYSLTPLLVKEDEEKEIRTILKKNGNSYSFSVISRVNPGEDAWAEHARGKIAPLSLTEDERKKYKIEEIEKSCNERDIIFHPDKYNGHRGVMIFGPRWNNLRRIKSGADRALGFLELPGEFSTDIDSYKLHPALLDVGNVVLKRIKEYEGTYVPAFYKGLRIKGALPGKVFFYVRDADENKPGAESLKYKVTVMDEKGTELVDIEEYTLRRVYAGTRTAGKFSGQAAEPKSRPLSFFIAAGKDIPQQVTPKDFLKDAISPAEGVDVFCRILEGEGWPQVVVATTDLSSRIAVRKDTGEGSGDVRRPIQKLARPELSTDYVTPKTNTERMLARIWEELLGIEEVGIYDDFFELGGDSLKAVNFGARIHKDLNTEVPISEFFNRPTIKQLAEYIERVGEKSIFYSIEPIEKRDYYILSSAQKRMYILQQMENEILGYNQPSFFLLEGNINKKKFENILEQLIERHESFRTSFTMVKGEPVQQVHDTRDVSAVVQYYDAGDREETEILKGFLRPFDLSRAPILRIGLVKLAETRHIFMVDVHHVVFDGMSDMIFLKEFMDLYADMELHPLKLQYKDYSQWRNKPENLEAKRKQEQYWIDLFSGEIPVLNLPVDFPRPAAQSFEGKRLSFIIEKEKTALLKTIADDGDATLYMVLLAIINVLLMKLSGQEDIVVGTPVAGRRHPDLDRIIGVFINSLAMRNFSPGKMEFGEFLGDVKEKALKAFENQDCQFEELLEKINVRRDASRNPLFDVMFRMQNFELPGKGMQQLDIEELKLKEYQYDPNKSILDLSFTAVESDNTVIFIVEYCTKLFKEETAGRFIGYLNAIVSAVIADPGIMLSRIDIIREKERKRLLYEFNDTAVDYPADKTIHQLFEEQAERTPAYTAVIGRGQDVKESCALTYRELNEKANQLALLLRAKGVEPGTIVGIMAGRSIEMMIGLLGILKAGAAYLPIDPDYPEERIKYVLKHSCAALLLTDEGEKGDRQIKSRPDVLHPAPCALRLAYVIYTSGSTGNPKGVMIRHRNVVNFIEGMTAKIPFSPGKSILALTTISFDIFLLETLLPITRGMSVVIADENQQKDPALLEEVILKNQIDMLQVTPSRLQLLLNPKEKENLSGLGGVQQLLVGGEAFPDFLLESLEKRFPGRIYNVYGPTETTIWSALKDLSGSRPGELTIGIPIANTQVYIVDGDMRVQPVGVAGELLIGGDGVAAGYLNNVELTAEKFLVLKTRRVNMAYLSYMSHLSKKIYKTGDLARWLPNGEIDFLGRLDHQVKIRGFRVELEEIEEQLLKQENIQDAVVVMKTRKTGDKSLCAYIVTSPDDFDASELREILSGTLPHYMIPSYFVPLEKITLTPNGKIDRKSLPDPDPSRKMPGATYVAPESDNEKVIAHLWREVLQVDEVGIHDNFFDLGGNSLNLIQLSWQLKETFGEEIPVAAMFRNLTVSYLDRYFTRGGSSGSEVDDHEREIKQTGALDRAKITYKSTIDKLTSNRRAR